MIASLSTDRLPWRVLVGKPGLDGHDRGARVIARTLRDAGMEVVYTGLFQTPRQIASVAIDEDVDAVGLSVLSGGHMTLLPAVIDELERAGGGHMLVFAGGIIPDRDIERLQELGVARVFTPGSSLTEITTWLDSTLRERAEPG